MARKPRRPLRCTLPERENVVMFDAAGRRVRGRTADIRRLYAQERCSIEEIAAHFGMTRCRVSYALRNKAALANRRIGLMTHGRGVVRLTYQRRPHVRAYTRWLTHIPATRTDAPRAIVA